LRVSRRVGRGGGGARVDRSGPTRRLIPVLALALLVAGCAKPDFYNGPKSDHFDGRHFFNPDGEQGTGGAQHESFWQYLRRAGHERHSWPKSVPVTPSRPPARVDGPRMLVTWIGHATVLVQADGLNILTDPVWAQRASPVKWAGVQRVRQPGVAIDDLPKIDLILISHDHYDHMDAHALKHIWKRDRPLIVTGLGNDVRLGNWGVSAVARDWGGTVRVRPGVDVILERAHHWSARTEDDKDLTLWTAFTVTLPGGNLYFAGDTGPGDMRWTSDVLSHGQVRLAILPIGAIHANSKVTGNHINPAQAVASFEQLGAGSALGIHWGTFELTDEPIDLPPTLLRRALAAEHIDPARFRVTEAGEPWWIPALPMPSPARPDGGSGGPDIRHGDSEGGPGQQSDLHAHVRPGPAR
jgi:L-ascorbate metabolism protein UlaG (beta-lactamase superfamily)